MAEQPSVKQSGVCWDLVGNPEDRFSYEAAHFDILWQLLLYFTAQDLETFHVDQSESSLSHDMSRVMRKPAFCLCQNKDADQLRSDREADQCLCFRYINSIITLLPKSEISRL